MVRRAQIRSLPAKQPEIETKKWCLEKKSKEEEGEGGFDWAAGEDEGNREAEKKEKRETK